MRRQILNQYFYVEELLQQLPNFRWKFFEKKNIFSKSHTIQRVSVLIYIIIFDRVSLLRALLWTNQARRHLRVCVLPSRLHPLYCTFMHNLPCFIYLFSIIYQSVYFNRWDVLKNSGHYLNHSFFSSLLNNSSFALFFITRSLYVNHVLNKSVKV